MRGQEFGPDEGLKRIKQVTADSRYKKPRRINSIAVLRLSAIYQLFCQLNVLYTYLLQVFLFRLAALSAILILVYCGTASRLRLRAI